MTNYPYGFDNNITLPGVSGSSQEDTAITALRSSVFAIEIELGITPSGIYPDVRTRLDILESRINFSTSAIEPGILNDGYVKSPLIIFNVPQNMALTISDGVGAPTEDRLDGSLYMRGVDGTANNQLYVRLGGTWHPVQTEQFIASNDLRGFPNGTDGHLGQTVIGLYNHPFRSTMDAVGPVEDGYHVTWNNADGYWEAQTGFIPDRDLAAFSGPYGRTAQTVIGIQGSPVSPTPPQDGYMFVWEATDGHWEPQHRTVIFGGSVIAGDGYITRTNIRSNKILQSPSANTTSRIGMVNFGSSTDGSGGTTENYAMILGGDRNTSSGIHSLVVGGFSNFATDGYAAVITGNGNVSSGINSVILNGVGNVASGVKSFIANGNLNLSSGDNSYVITGTNNVAGADYSGILNGFNNSIPLGAIHTLIGSGHDNQITGASSEHSVIMGGDTNSVNSANNTFMGTASGSSTAGNFSVVLSGVSNTIATLSDYAVILSGNANSATSSSEYSFIGSGNNNTVTFHHSTVLNGDSCTSSGLHGAILNGANNTVTGDHSTIINGHDNSIIGAFAHGIILDGYNNSITGPGSFIGDGYNNSISGSYSSIINGNFNSIAGRNSTILNGGSNTIDLNSFETTVLTGDTNTFTSSANSTVAGSGNIFNSATSTFIIGTFNNVQSTASFINGSSNILSSGTSFNRIFGSNNLFSTGSTVNFAVGNSNSFAPNTAVSNSFAFGSNNIIDSTNGSFVNGNNNIAAANLTTVRGKFGKARMFGQEVSANSRFTLGKIGEAQWSRLMLAGSSVAGASIPVQLQDSSPTNPTFLDGYSYDIQLRILIVNTSNITVGTSDNGKQPVLPARMVYDILAHKEQSDTNLVLDNVNETLITPNTVDRLTRTPWTVSISTSGNELIVTVDSEIPSSEISTYSGGFLVGTPSPSDRRVTATLEMREISRI